MRPSVLAGPLVGLAFTLLGFAGCLEPGAPSGPVLPVALSTSITVLPEAAGSEPSVLVASDGVTVYVAAPTAKGDAGVNRVWRSDDAGRTYTLISEVAPEFQTGDATVATAPDGTLFVGTLEIMDPVTQQQRRPLCNAVSVSKDKGASWTTNALACPAPVYWDRPWVVASDRFAYVLQWHPDGVVGGLVSGLSVSPDQGATWAGFPAAIGPTPEAVHGAPAVDGGKLYVPFTAILPRDDMAGLYGPTLAIADEPGVVWTQVDLAQDLVGGNFPVAAKQGEAGIVVWTASTDPTTRDAPQAVRASVLRDGKWDEAIDIDATGTNAFAWAAAKGGHVAVAWLHAESDQHPNMVPNGTAWSVRVWVDGKASVLDPLVHSGPACVVILGVGPCAKGSRSIGDFLSVDLLPGGQPVVAYSSSTEAHPEHWGTLKVALGAPASVA